MLGLLAGSASRERFGAMEQVALVQPSRLWSPAGNGQWATQREGCVAWCWAGVWCVEALGGEGGVRWVVHGVWSPETPARVVGLQGSGRAFVVSVQRHSPVLSLPAAACSEQ